MALKGAATLEPSDLHTADADWTREIEFRERLFFIKTSPEALRTESSFCSINLEKVPENEEENAE